MGRALALATQPQPSDEPTVLLSPDEAGARLHMPGRGVLKMARRGEIGCVRFTRRVFFTEGQIEAFIAEHVEDQQTR